MKRANVIFAYMMILFLIAPERAVGAPAVPVERDFSCGSYVYNGFHIPAMVTNETWYMELPDHIYGTAVWYAPWMMEGTARYREMSLKGFKGGVAMPSAGEIGSVVWLRRDRVGEWEGPYLVVDTSQRNHQWFHIVNVESVVEVDFKTAVRWGILTLDKTAEKGYRVNYWFEPYVEVYEGLVPPVAAGDPQNLKWWFYQHATFCDGERNRRWYPNGEDFIANYDDYAGQLEDWIGGIEFKLMIKHAMQYKFQAVNYCKMC